MENLSMNNKTPVQTKPDFLKTITVHAGELVLGRNQLIREINNSDIVLDRTTMETIWGVKESIVIFKNMETEYFAAPFKHVLGIEKFKTDDIERIENRRVIQYHGKALRLYEITEIADVLTPPKKEFQEVIVFKVNGKEFGLMVAQPMVIFDAHLYIDKGDFKRLGIKGTMSFNGHTTLVLDIPETAESFWMEVCNYV